MCGGRRLIDGDWFQNNDKDEKCKGSFKIEGLSQQDWLETTESWQIDLLWDFKRISFAEAVQAFWQNLKQRRPVRDEIWMQKSQNWFCY